MDESSTIPFDQVLKTPEIEMLNAALPYVSNQMRKPLAIYIKSSEISRIFSDFDREDILSACGFESNTPDPEAMLKAMKIAGGKNAGPQIDQMLQMMNMVKTYQRINEMMQSNPEMMSFLNSMMNQTQTSGSSRPDKSISPDRPNLSEKSNPAGSMDSSDMMTLLSQMLKNSR